MADHLGQKEVVHPLVEDLAENDYHQLIVVDDAKMVVVEVERPKVRMITAEPILVGTAFCTTMTGAVTVDLILRQACRSYGASMDECSANSTIEDEAQKIVANVQAANMVISNILPILFCLIVGPWSDTNGRKPFLILAVCGLLAQWVAYAFLASIENLSPMFLIAPAFAVMVTGGQPAVTMLAYCYFSDGASESNKTFRMGIGMTGIVMASCVGPLLGNLIYNGGTYLGYISVYATCSLILFSVFLYTIFSLPETVNFDKEKRQKLFTFKHLLGTYDFLRRKRSVRTIVLISLICLIACESTVVVTAEIEVFFLSLKKKFQWDVDAYSNFIAFYQGMSCIYMTLILWFFTSLLKMSDSLALFISLALSTVSMLVFATSNSSTGVYIANLVGGAIKMTAPIYRSMLTKVVNAEETGSAMTIATVLETVTMPSSSVLYAKIYGLVVSRNPFEVYYLPTSFAAAGAITALGIHYFQPKKGSSNG